MASPTDDTRTHLFPRTQRSLDDDGTFIGEDSSHPNSRDGRDRSYSYLSVNTEHAGPIKSMLSPSQTREQAHRLDDDLAMLQIERQVSSQQEAVLNREQSQSRSVRRSRSRRDDPIDEFDAATNPLHEKAALYKPPENPATSVARLFKKVHNSSFIVRYIIYITPLVLILLIPLLLGALLFTTATVGGVKLVWFSIWLEIVWLTLWAGRVRVQRLCDSRSVGSRSLTRSDSCQMFALADWAHFQPLHQQQQEMAGHGQTARGPCHPVLLVAGH